MERNERESAVARTNDEIALGVLGPLMGTRAGESVSLGGPKQLCVLAILIAEAPRSVTADKIAQAVYGDDAPERGRRRVQTYVSTLRSLLGEVILRAGEGWVLSAQETNLDIDQFEAMVIRAGSLRATEASRLLADALALWRGNPYAGIEAHGHLDAEIRRLEELRLLALEQRIDADLDVGNHADLVPELAALVAEHPHRENLRSRHMIALYRSGRQKEALASFDALRVLLLEELGVDPTPELRDLQKRILQQDDSLAAAEEPDGEPLRGYRLHEQLGCGPFSTVWRGTQPSIKRPVAIKQIRGELATRPAFIRSFEAEALLIARVEHPHIVPLIDYWRDPQGAYLVMRWLPGGTVEQALAAGSWSVERTLKMARQVGDALEYAHARDVIHRDVTTSNILLDGAGNAFLGDFGIALEAKEAASAEVVTSRGVLPYAAPEKLRKEPLDLRADVFSFAVVIYECLTGSQPFAEASTDAELIRRQLAEPYPRLTVARPDVPSNIADAVARATSKSPNERFESVLDFVDALEASHAPESPDRSDAGAAAHTPSIQITNPYKGLRTFDEPDAGEFFGRARLVDELVDRLGDDDVGSRCITLVGPSGSGKSSVVRAGLIPALRQGRVAGASDWFITTMIPGAHPFEALEAALLRVAVNPPASLLHQLQEGQRGILRGVRRCLPTEGDDIVLIVDQLEELFSAAPADRAHNFLTALAAAVGDPASPLRVVASLRADYYDRPLSHPTFAEVLKAGAVDVTPLAPNELELAISQPALQQGVRFEQGLIARISADAQGQPGSLPLLQHTMAELFETQSAGMLTIEQYESSGGLAQALATRADELYALGSDREQATTRRIFGQLVDPTALSRPASTLRRRVLRRDLGDDPATKEVVERFAAARLLTFDRDPASRAQTVEVAHEALLREWPRLGAWLDEDRSILMSVGHLERSADFWQNGGRQPADLYRGARVQTASDVAQFSHERLRAIDRDFIEQSLAEAEAERTGELRRVQRLQRLVAGVAIALVVSLIAGAVALQQNRRASDRAIEASARGLAAQATSLSDRELDTALLLAANGAAQSASAATEAGLLHVLNAAASLESTRSFPGPTDLAAPGTLFFSGDTAVGLFDDGMVRAYDLRTEEQVGPAIAPELDGVPPNLALSGNGQRIAIQRADGYGVWDVATGRQLVSGIAHGDDVARAWLSQRGSYVLVFNFATGATTVFSVDDNRSLGVLSAEGAPLLGWPRVSMDESTLYFAGSTGEGAGTYSSFSLPDLMPIDAPTELGFVANVAVPNLDESVLAVANWADNAAVTLLDAATLEAIAPTVDLQAGRLASIEWNPSSTRVLVGTLTGEFAVISASGIVEERIIGRASIPEGSGWIDDDRFMVVSDGIAMTWNLSLDPAIATPAGSEPSLGFADVQHDGTYIINYGPELEVASPQGERRRIALGETVGPRCFPVHAQPTGDLAVLLCFVTLPDGEETAGFAVVDIGRGVVVQDPIPVTPGFGIRDIAISESGDMIAIAGMDEIGKTGLLQVVDAQSGDVLAERNDLDPFLLTSAAWSPDGQQLLVGGEDGELLFVDPDSLEVLTAVPLTVGFSISEITVDSTEQSAVVATEQGQVWRFDLETRAALGEPLVGAASQFQSAAFSPSGDRAAATGRDGRIRIWDVESGRIIGPSLAGGEATHLRFIDDDTILSWKFFGEAFLWDLDTTDLVETACRLAGRSLTESELAAFADDLDVDTCA